jgi:hypothetical protein
MQASPHGEYIIQPSLCFLINQLMKRNERVGVGTENGRVLKIELTKLQLGFFTLAIVPLLASNLASAATDALGGIHQRCFDEG